MPLDTTKSVKSITYNGTNIPLYSKPEQTKTVDLSMASGNQVVSPDSGKVLSKVTVNKPSTLIPDNIKKDVNIGGVVGTLESGGGSSYSSETWVINDGIYTSAILPEEALATGEVTFQISFTSNNLTFSSISMREELDNVYDLYYDETAIGSGQVVAPNNEWFIHFNNEMYRKLTFSTAPTGDLLTWLQASAVKQEANIAVWPSKALTITSNGTTTVTPDVPYDAMGQVDLTVNVAGVDMCSLTIKSSGPVIGASRVWYFDGENTAQVAAYKTPVQVVKNSIIFSNEIFQNTTMLTDVGNGGDGRYAYQITGDCVATVGF